MFTALAMSCADDAGPATSHHGFDAAGASGDAASAGGAAGDAPSTGGAGAGGLSIGPSDGEAGPSCTWPKWASAPTDASAPLQSWCEPGSVNPSGCPATPPKPGDPCPMAGLVCAYGAADDYITAISCDSHWTEAAHRCTRPTCEAPDGGSVVVSSDACGSAGERQCFWASSGTRYEALQQTLAEIAQCCGLFTEDTLTVWLEDGCATQVRVGRSDSLGQATAECARALLSGYRIACSTGSECVEIHPSTLK
jgi:hypothetical protein